MTIPRRVLVHPIAAATLAGVALWVSRASFDVAGSAQLPVRVAMMPSAAELLGLVIMFLLIAAGVALLLRNGAEPDAPFWGAASDTLLPLFALGLLLLPYLPFLADWIPALRLLAGPGRILVWLVVIGQTLWIFLPQLSRRMGLSTPLLDETKASVVFACTAVFLSAPFVFNARALTQAFGDLLENARHLPTADLSAVPAASLAFLFDQEFGVLPSAPVLVLAFIGLAAMMRDRSQRWVGVALTIVSVCVIALAASADPWWRRSFAPGRQLVLLLPLLTVPIASLYSRLPRFSISRAGAQVSYLVTLGITLVFLLFEEPVPVQQDGIGASYLLRWLSPTWQLWSEVPTYVTSGALVASTRVVLWIAGVTLMGWLLSRRSANSLGRVALLVTLGAVVACVAIPTITAAVVSDPSNRFNVESRTLIPLLETFDPVARPVALRYDPFSVAQSDELPPLFALSAVPGQRTGRQPLRVVLNARFRLPAGSYELDVEGSKSAGSVPDAAIFLQLGREGGALTSWPLTMTAGQHARHVFEVPLDSEFVAFRAAPSLEPTIASIRITPVTVAAIRKRFPAPRVLAASAFATVTAFFHGGAFPESEGFWVQGRETTRVTLLKQRDSDQGVTLAIHSGARPNTVTLATNAWSQTLNLVQGVTERVVVPTKEGDPFIPLTITATGGFVPAEIERSPDRRVLGAWIAFIPDETGLR